MTEEANDPGAENTEAVQSALAEGAGNDDSPQVDWSATGYIGAYPRYVELGWPGILPVGRSNNSPLSKRSVEIDDEHRAGRRAARKHGRKVLIPVAELRRWINALPSDEMHFALKAVTAS
jgi:hypothetical protein